MDQTCTPPPEALPKWLTEEYFRSLFRRKSPGEVIVQNVTVKFADEERIHGRLIRAAVDVDTPTGTKTLSYVVKRPGPGQFSTTPASANMYRMESLVLGEVIPAMEKVLDAVAPGKFGQLAPRLVDYDLGENRFIMTEDLSVQDFCTLDRRVGLDLEHSLAYVRHLAVFHAASVAVMSRYQSEIDAIPLYADSEEVKFLNEFIGTSMQGVQSVIDSWEDGSEYADRVRALGASLPARLAQANRARGGVLDVLCHGDMFVNNILFRAGGDAAAVRLVDFELSRVGSFADDLAGFVVSAASAEVQRDHWERVIEEYRVTLNSVLTALGHGARALSQEAVREALRAQRAVAQFALFHMLPRARTPGTAVDLDAAGEAFTAPAFRDLLRLLLPRFRELRWLDESQFTTEKFQTQVPCWLNREYFQNLLQQQSPGAVLTVERVDVTKSEDESTSTTNVYLVAVIVFPSQVNNKVFRVRCPGDGVFCKMPTQICMLGMESPVLGKLVPVVEEITARAVSGKFNPLALRLTDQAFNSISKKDGFRFMFGRKSLDLKFYLTILCHLALLRAGSMIALEQNSYSLPDISKFSSSDLKDYVKKSLKAVISLWIARQKGKERELHSDVPDEDGQLETQGKVLNYCDEIEQEIPTEVSDEHVQLKTLKAIMKQRCLKSKQVQREKETSKIGCVDKLFNKRISRTSHINRLVHSSETTDNLDNTTDQSEEHFTTFQTSRGLSQNQDRSEVLKREPGTPGDCSEDPQSQLEAPGDRSEDLQSQLETPGDRITLFCVPPQVTRRRRKAKRLKDLSISSSTSLPFAHPFEATLRSTSVKSEVTPSQFNTQCSVDRISFSCESSQASTPKTEYLCSRIPPFVDPFVPQHLGQCRPTERFLPQLNTSFVHVYT